jgi:DNA-binding PadR family transcriptional regulator
MSGTTGMEERNIGPRRKTAAASEEGEDNRQRHQEDEAGDRNYVWEAWRQFMRSRTKHRAEDREANSQVFHDDSKNEC